MGLFDSVTGTEGAKAPSSDTPHEGATFDSILGGQPPPSSQMSFDSVLGSASPSAQEAAPSFDSILGSKVAEAAAPTGIPATTPIKGEKKGAPPFAGADLLPRHVKLSHLNGIATPGMNQAPDTDGLRDPVVDATYNLSKLAEKDGYKFHLNSAKRQSTTYHGYGEAVDGYFTDAQGKELSPLKQTELGRKYGYMAGFASMLNEQDASLRAITGGSGPHLHFAWGNEDGIKHPENYFFRSRKPGDKGYDSPTKVDLERKDLSSGRKDLARVAEISALQAGVDPEVFSRLIRSESAGNENAVSPVGARGLTQIMPETLAGMLKGTDLKPEDVYKDSRLQMIYGAKYLSQMMKQSIVGNSYARGLAAYNAGPGGLQKMIDSGSVYPETAQYVFNTLKDLDPSIKTVDDARKAILTGGGYQHDPKHLDNRHAAMVNDAQSQISQTFGEFLGAAQQEVVHGKTSAFNVDNSLTKDTWIGKLLGEKYAKRPLDMLLGDTEGNTWGDAANELTKRGYTAPLSQLLDMSQQFLHHLTFNAIPEAEHLKNVSKTTSGIEQFTQYSVPNFLSAAGAIGLTMEAGAGVVAKAFGLGGETTGFMAGGKHMINEAMMGSQWSKYGLGSFGALAGEGMVRGTISHLMDNINEPNERWSKMGLKEKTYEALGAGFFNGLMNTAFGWVAPQVTSIGNQLMKSTLATGEAMGMMKDAPFIARATGGMLTGATSGGLLGGAADMMGLDQLIAGQDIDGLSMISGGMKIGGVMGAGTNAVAGPAMKALAKSPMFNEFLTQFGGLVAAADQKLGGKLAAGVIKAANEAHVQQNVESYSAAASQLSASHDTTLRTLGEMEQGWDKGVGYAKQKFESLKTLHDGEVQRMEQIKSTTPDFDSKIEEYQILAGERQRVLNMGKDDPQIQSRNTLLTSSNKQIAAFTEKNPQIPEYATIAQKLQQMQEPLQQAQLIHQSAAQASEKLKLGFQMAREQVQGAKMSLDRVLEEAKASPEAAADIFNRSGLVEKLREKLDVNPHVSTEVFDAIGKDWGEALGAGVPSKALKDITVAHLDKIDQSIAESVAQIVRDGKDPNLVISRIMNRALKAIDPEADRMIPSFYFTGPEAEMHKTLSYLYPEKVKDATGKLVTEKPNFKPVLEPKMLNGELSFADSKDYSVKIRYDLMKESVPNRISNQGKEREYKRHIRGYAPSMVLSWLEAQGEKMGIDPSLLRAQDPTTYLKDLGTKGAKVPDLEAVSYYAHKAENGKLLSEGRDYLSEVYTQVQAAQHVADSHIPVVTSAALNRKILNPRDGHITKAIPESRNFMREGNAFSEKLREQFSPESIGAIPAEGANASLGEAVARADQSWSPKYLLGEMGKTKRGLDTLRMSYNVAEDGTIKFDSSLFQKDLAAELQRLNTLDSLVAGKAGQPKDGVQPLALDSTRQNLANSINTNVGKDPGKFRLVLDSILGKGRDMVLIDRMHNDANYDYAAYVNGLANPKANVDITKIRPMVHTEFGEIHNRLNMAEHITTEVSSKFRDHIDDVINKIQDERPTMNADKFQHDCIDAAEGTISVQQFREMYKTTKDPKGELAGSVLGYFNEIKKLNETILGANHTNLKDFMRALYVPALFPKAMAANKMAAVDGAWAALVGKRSAENKRGFTTFASLRKNIDAIKEEIFSKTSMDAEQFSQLPQDVRAEKLMGISKTQLADMKNQDPKKYKETINTLEFKSNVHLFEDHVSDITHLATSGLKATMRADAYRRLVKWGTETNVDLGAHQAPEGRFRSMVVINETPFAETGLIRAERPNGKVDAYKQASTLPGFEHATFEINKKTVPADQVLFHPEMWDALDSIGKTSEIGGGEMGQVFNRLTHFSRNATLIGGFSSFLSTMTGSAMSGFMHAPLKAAAVHTLGGEILNAPTLTHRQMVVDAIRGGVNYRAIDQSARLVTKHIQDLMGPDMAGAINGTSDSKFVNFLDSLVGDASNPRAGMAYEGLSPSGKIASNILGGPLQMDYAQMRVSQFRAIEAGMFGHYYFKLAELQKAMGKNLEGVPPEVATKVLQQTASQLTNLRSGTLPFHFNNPTTRQLLSSTVLTPGWMMSKANMFIDALDGVVGLGMNVIGKNPGMAKEVGILSDQFAKLGFKKRYENYTPEQKGVIRTEMAKSFGGLILSGALMSYVFNYMQNGASPMTTNPPDKWFHVKVGDHYYSNPLLFGATKDFINMFGSFTGDMVKDKGLAESTWGAVTNLLERTLAPSQKMLASVVMGKDMETGRPIAGTYTGEGASAAWGKDLAGYMLRKTVNYNEILGMNSNASISEALRMDPNYHASALSPQEYWLRTLGSTKSNANEIGKLQYEFKARLDQYRNTAQDKIKALFMEMKDHPEKGDKIINDIMRYHTEGVEMHDKDLAPLMPGGDGRFRLTQQQIMNIGQKVLHPEQYALQGVTTGSPAKYATALEMQRKQAAQEVVGGH